jgi:hypothetical protein
MAPLTNDPVDKMRLTLASARLLESVDETLTALLSKEVLVALYAYLERVHSIPKAEVPYRVQTLSSTLERIFGPHSSRTISKAVAKKFYTKLGLTFPDKQETRSWTLVEYVEEAKLKLSGNRV